MKDLKKFFIEQMKSKKLECRAWDIRNKEMIKVDDIQWYNSKTYKIDDIDLKPKKNQPLMINTKSAWRVEDEIILMWHFGQLNINKTKVFEGDILEIFNRISTETYYMIYFYSKWCGAPCLLEDGTFYHEILGFLDDNKNINGKVVGNIFENYDLLKEED